MNLYAETNVDESVFKYKWLGHGWLEESPMTNGKGNHHNNSTFYQKNIKEQNSKTLMNQNYLKTIFVNILKKPVPVQIVSGKASKKYPGLMRTWRQMKE